jgi:hypothetical protein
MLANDVNCVFNEVGIKRVAMDILRRRINRGDGGHKQFNMEQAAKIIADGSASFQMILIIY